MEQTQDREPKEKKRNFDALHRALEALKLAMENQLMMPKSGETGMESPL